MTPEKRHFDFMCRLDSKNFRILLLLSISNSRNSDFTVARENILLVVHQETNGWYRSMAGGGGWMRGAAGMVYGCRLMSRQVMRGSE